METTKYIPNLLIINYLCDNTKIGMQNNTARIEIPYSHITLKKVHNDPKTYQERIKKVVVERCPFNQIQRVKCDIYAQLRITEGEIASKHIIKLYENVTLV